ncbi:MAG: S9 family peptidase [Alphaproteobacteria bacterium]|nr:S9 family peptidase [Alphaproteobacteria bacterium]MBV9371799.1 S9 family peptidase [Alphaproteobacteria bacterium]MBV9901916.1 S9 family peptidase [Alphaproteobacteria bacterium]
MLKRICAVILLAGLAAPAAAAPPEGPATTFAGIDLFSLEVASDPQISPDGTRIAYVRRSGDVMTDRMRSTLWLVDTRSGEQLPLVAGPGNHSQPRWSPDGRRLAYVSSGEGGAPQLFVRWMESGQSVRITGLPQSPSSIAWSPDGRRIAYSMFVPDDDAKLGAAPPKPDGAQWAPALEIHTAVAYRSDADGYVKPGYTQLFLVSADGGAPRQLTFGARNNDGPLSWSPDGRTLVFSGNRNANWEREPFDTEIYALDVDGGTVRTLTDRRGPDEQPVVSPDGRLIAYVGYDDKRLSYQSDVLYVMNRDGSGRRALAESLDRSVNAPVWAADGRSIYVSYEDRGLTRVSRIGLDGSVRPVTDALAGSGLDRPYAGGSFTVARNGAVAITAGSPARPADVAVVSGGASRQLTHLNADLLGGKRLGEVRKIAVTSFDNRPIDAWLTLPPSWREGQRVPLILEIHGGPVAAYGPYFSTDNQLYAAAGYAVLSTNPRGSSSYGAEFANLIHHAYPGRDYDDLMAAVDAAVAQGFADPQRLFVTGGSGGGVLTTWIVGKTDRFKAAAAQKPVINWTSEALTMDMTLFTSRYWFEKLPWEDPTAYWSRSPLSLAGNIHTPTLVVVGSEDYRTPVSEAEQLYAALQIRGVPTALVKVPGVGHGAIASRPSQAAAKAAAIIAWFRKYENGAN